MRKAAVLFSAAALAALAACGHPPPGKPHSHGEIALACVNEILGTDAPLPQIVVLKRSDFAERFSAGHDGYYDDGVVYLSSARDRSVLPHELAHHAQAHAGRALDEDEARYVARRCQGQAGA